MTGLGITLIIWGSAILAVGIIALWFGVRYFKKGRAYHDQQKALLIEAEKRVKLQYNKIATLTPNELTIYLGGVFSRILELNSIESSDKDNLVYERLYTNTLADMLTYLGTDTIRAIEYYYGSEYIEKWSNLAFRILENHRRLGAIIRGETTYETFEHILHSNMVKDNAN